MSALEWGAVGKKFYETGIDRGVFYPRDSSGVAWPGLVSVSEKVVGGEVTPYYLDERKTIDFVKNVDFQAKVQAFSAPPEFRYYDGCFEIQRGLFATQQKRRLFDFSYRTLVFNELGQSHYKIHLVYNVLSTRQDLTRSTISNKNDVSLQTWIFDTIPPLSETKKPTAHLIINTSQYSSAKIQELENLLYGTNTTNPSFPTQETVAAILEA